MTGDLVRSPPLLLVVRGQWREIEFLSVATGGAAWWLVEPIAPPLSREEEARLDYWVGVELVQRQRVWRDRQADRRRLAQRPGLTARRL